MSDVVVTVPKAKWREWLDEGDLAHTGDAIERAAAWAGEYEYGFTMAGPRPDTKPGERVYIVAHGRLRGWSPLAYFDDGRRFGGKPGSWALVRRGDAIACTIAAPIVGFQGWRRRWWDRVDELPFPDWRTRDVDPSDVRAADRRIQRNPEQGTLL